MKEQYDFAWFCVKNSVKLTNERILTWNDLTEKILFEFLVTEWEI